MNKCLKKNAYVEITFGTVFTSLFLLVFIFGHPNAINEDFYIILGLLLISLLHIVLGIFILKGLSWSIDALRIISFFRLIGFPIGTFWALWTFKCLKRHGKTQVNG